MSINACPGTMWLAESLGGWVIGGMSGYLEARRPGVGDLGLGQVKEPAAAQAERQTSPLIRSLIIWEVSEVKQPLQEAFSQTARASAPYRPTMRRYFAVLVGDEVLGFDDGCFELLELRLVGNDLFVELLLEGGDLGTGPFDLVLELLDLGGFGFDDLVARGGCPPRFSTSRCCRGRSGSGGPCILRFS